MKKSYRICAITKNGTNPAYEGARIGMGRVASRMGCVVEHFFPKKPDDVVEQGELIEAALGGRPDAILLAPTHPTALNAAIHKIEEAGIPLINFVSSTEGTKPWAFISSNNHSLAFSVAAYLIDLMGGSGDLAVIEGSSNSSTSLPRTKGFLEAVAAHPRVRVVAQRSGYYQREDAQRAMADILERTPKIDGVLSANDFMAMGVLDALAEANRSAFVVGVNAMPDAIQAIKAGQMQATAAYDAMKMGCIAVEAAIRFLLGLSVPDHIELPVEIVDLTNCAAWDQPYEERPLPVWKAVVANGR